ncbi:MAG: aminoacyl-tRNA hydrolase, partial [Rhodobacterales bacterium]
VSPPRSGGGVAPAKPAKAKPHTAAPPQPPTAAEPQTPAPTSSDDSAEDTRNPLQKLADRFR